MAIDNFFNHKCTIFHIAESEKELGYGISNEHDFTYPDNAEENDTDIPCHFHVGTGTWQVSQETPFNQYLARVKLSLPLGTDIRVNDKVVSGETGYAYIAELPRKIQNHHIIVYCNRSGTIKEAI
jgi:hypothetical protein